MSERASASARGLRASWRNRATDLAILLALLGAGPALLLAQPDRPRPVPVPAVVTTVSPAATLPGDLDGPAGKVADDTNQASVPVAALDRAGAPAAAAEATAPTVAEPRSGRGLPSVAGREPLNEPPPLVFTAPTPTAPAGPGLSLPSLTLPWDPGPRVTVLLLGIDARLGSDELSRTDTMIIATIDPRNRTAAMLSIPRDLWVRIPDATSAGGFYEDRINVAYFLGQRYKYPGGGAALAKRTVEQNFGIPIDYTARIDFAGFERAVDSVGGITVDVPKVLADGAYPTEDYGFKTIYFPPGRQRMDGHLALMYARSRHGDNDLERGRRQQAVLLGVRDELLSVQMVPRLPALLGVLRGTLSTDMPFGDTLRLSRAITSIDRGRITSRAFDATMCYGVRTALGADILIPRWASIKTVVDDLFGGSRRVGAPAGSPPDRSS